VFETGTRSVLVPIYLECRILCRRSFCLWVSCWLTSWIGLKWSQSYMIQHVWSRRWSSSLTQFHPFPPYRRRYPFPWSLGPYYSPHATLSVMLPWRPHGGLELDFKIEGIHLLELARGNTRCDRHELGLPRLVPGKPKFVTDKTCRQGQCFITDFSNLRILNSHKFDLHCSELMCLLM
jgi:hypothetical protein